MNIFFLGYLSAQFLFAVCFLFVGTFFLLFLERFVYARVQHRDGPGRAGKVDIFQVFRDFLKVYKKERRDTALEFRFRFIFMTWKLLPIGFIWLLLVGGPPGIPHDAELPSLFLLVLFSVVAEAILMSATEDHREIYQLREQLLLRVLGLSLMLLAWLTVSLRIGNAELASISQFQRSFPFFSILSDPGLFFSGITAFFSIYLISGAGLAPQDDEISLRGSWQYTFFFVRRIWIFCFVTFWVFLFLGGTAGLISKFLFPFKIAGMLFFFFFLQVSFPKVRIADAESLAVRWLLPLSLLGFVLEALWMGAFR